ncbi:MAG: glycerophosphodiester phosphodiesterase [Armatimonadota bacterium]
MPAGFQFIVVSHRGAGFLAPENTLSSFQLGWKMGTIPEGDIRTTSDGVIVTFHDNTLSRLAPGAPQEIKSKGIKDLPWATVSKLDVGEYLGPEYRGQRVARLDEVFDEMKGHPDRWLYLDIKDVSLERMAKMALQRGIENQLILASTDYRHIREWKRMLPTSGTLLWMGGEEAALKKRIDDLRKVDFADITQFQIHVNVGDLNAAEPFSPRSAFLSEVAKEIKAKGILYSTWVRGSDNPDAYRKLLTVGFNSFSSDDPQVALKVMREHFASR